MGAEGRPSGAFSLAYLCSFPHDGDGSADEAELVHMVATQHLTTRPVLRYPRGEGVGVDCRIAACAGIGGPV